MSGETLLDRCLAAHGGLDRWRQFGAIDVDLTTSGLVFATHGAPSLRTMARVATRDVQRDLTGQFIPFMSGVTAACGAVEALSRTLATEFGSAGVRVGGV